MLFYGFDLFARKKLIKQKYSCQKLPNYFLNELETDFADLKTRAYSGLCCGRGEGGRFTRLVQRSMHFFKLILISILIAGIPILHIFHIAIVVEWMSFALIICYQGSLVLEDVASHYAHKYLDDCFDLRSFVRADVDFDGKVSVEEFDSMIEAAAALPR